MFPLLYHHLIFGLFLAKSLHYPAWLLLRLLRICIVLTLILILILVVIIISIVEFRNNVLQLIDQNINILVVGWVWILWGLFSFSIIQGMVICTVRINTRNLSLLWKNIVTLILRKHIHINRILLFRLKSHTVINITTIVSSLQVWTSSRLKRRTFPLLERRTLSSITIRRDLAIRIQKIWILVLVLVLILILDLVLVLILVRTWGLACRVIAWIIHRRRFFAIIHQNREKLLLLIYVLLILLILLLFLCIFLKITVKIASLSHSIAYLHLLLLLLLSFFSRIIKITIVTICIIIVIVDIYNIQR